MAELIPSSVRHLKSATSGERKVYQLLADAFQDDAAIIWYEPKALGRYTDFIVWLPEHGLLVIEVKDWSKDKFISLNPENFMGTFYDKNNAVVSVQNPEQQARKYMLNVLNQCKKSALFTHTMGRYKGNLKFPVSFCVIYTELKRLEAEEIELLLPAITTEHKVLFKDDLKVRKTNIVEDQQHFKSQLFRAFEGIKFSFPPLSYAEEKALRYMIFPEIRVNNFEQNELFYAEPQAIKALDITQELVAKNIGDGHRILKGVAGSGKTLVLACRAKYLKTIYPDWKILVVCYNNSLCNHLKSMLGEEYQDKIEVRNFHAVVKHITQANLQFKPFEKQNDYNGRVGQILLDYIDQQKMLEQQFYDAILIDEGQDFAQEWILGLTRLVRDDSDNILFCYDPAQNIFNRAKPSWKSIGLQVQGKRPTELSKCYRNTKEILDIARSFLNPKLLESLKSQDEFDRVLDPDTGECRQGEFPSIYHQDDVEHLADLIARKIRFLVGQNAEARDIAVLQAKSEAYDVLAEQIKNKILHYSPQLEVDMVFSSQEKKKLDITRNTIKILNVESSKGLEFPYVFFIGLDHMPRLESDSRDLDSEKKLAFVGMTRAQLQLFILGREDKGFLAEVKQLHAEAKRLLEPKQQLPLTEDIEDSSMIGKAWTEDEEVKMIDAFMIEKLSIKAIAQLHQRKEGGIRSRLKKLRLID